jgi:hypothetical protein
MAGDASPKASGKGAPPSSSSAGPDVVQDLFRRVSGLGGFLVLAYVAPMAGSGQGSAMAEALAAVGGEAKEINRELAELVESRFRARYDKKNEG